MAEHREFNPVSSPVKTAILKKQSIGMLIVAVFLTLWAYQFEHHGLWGKLVNYNKTPKLVLAGSSVNHNALNLDVYRPNGPDTYGSFVVQVAIRGIQETTPAEVWGPKQLARIGSHAIHNKYFFQKVSDGPWGFIVPLSAQAVIRIPLTNQALSRLTGQTKAVVTVEDVSGLQWQATIPVQP